MSMIKALRTLAAIENGSLSASQLETQVSGSQARKDEISQLLMVKSLFPRIAASRTAMNALCGSATTWAEIAAHRYFTTFLAECVESVNAKMAIYNSDTALNSISTSAAAMAVMRAASKYSVTSVGSANGTSSVSISSAYLPGTYYILLGLSHSSTTSYTYSVSTRRSGSTIPNTSIYTSMSSNTNGADSNVALPITTPYSFASQVGNSATTYFGVLRCDI